MLIVRPLGIAALALCLFIGTAEKELAAATVTVELGHSQGVKLVGAIARWDKDGNPRQLPDQKAKIDAPHLDATALSNGSSQWVFKDLAPGKYDLLIMGEGHLRIEGFQYVPVNEFDPFFPPDTKIDEEARDFIVNDIKASQHFENKVVPLYLSGDKKAVRVLVMLIRDLPTSYKKGAGTIRHEMWQYNWNYGGWQKDKRTKVLDRVMLDVSELRQWTWLWDPKLGGIEVGKSPLTIHYDLPHKSAEEKVKGLYPY
jgi:hypothetical protein